MSWCTKCSGFITTNPKGGPLCACPKSEAPTSATGYNFIPAPRELKDAVREILKPKPAPECDCGYYQRTGSTHNFNCATLKPKPEAPINYQEMRHNMNELLLESIKPNPPPAQAPREWWIYVGIHADAIFLTKPKRGAAGAEDVIHVIEHSAYTKLLAENARLRGALERIVTYDPKKGMIKVMPHAAIIEVYEIAREALADCTHTPKK